MIDVDKNNAMFAYHSRALGAYLIFPRLRVLSGYNREPFSQMSESHMYRAFDPSTAALAGLFVLSLQNCTYNTRLPAWSKQSFASPARA